MLPLTPHSLSRLVPSARRYFIDRSSAQLVDPRVQAALFIFAVANSTVNPLVYGYFNVRRGSRNPPSRQEWRMKRIVYKPPYVCYV